MSEKKNRRGIIKNNFWMLRRVWGYVPWHIVFMVVEGVLWGINHSVGIIYTKRLLDALSEGAPFEDVLRIIIYFAVYILVFWGLHYIYWQVFVPLQREKLHRELHCDLFKNAVGLDLKKYDDPEFYNDFIWSMDEAYNHVTALVEDTGKLINRVIATVTITSVLFSVDWLMAVIIFALSALRIVFTTMYNRARLKYVDECNPLHRKDGYIKRVFMLPDYAKELRVTRVSECLLDEYNKNTDRKNILIRKHGTILTVYWFLICTIMQIGESGLLLLMLYKVMVTGTASLGTFAVAITAIWRMSWTLRDLVDRLLKYHEHGIFIEKMINFVNCKPEITDGNQTAGEFESLEIKELRFAYNENSDPALDGVSLKINRGERIAVVGYNGAGKTTLTKLLLRLYNPTKGEILYNGKPLGDYTVDSLRSRVAAVFQDYRIFASTIAENVTGGEYDDGEHDRVESALRKSTFTDKLNSLPDGLSTPLTREFYDNGTVLSGGEQQKVAIARAFYKDADLIILDEPSSALDPDAEYELNRAISQYAEDKTVIFISHRLSTTRHADRIYMFDGGTLAECGSHEELIAHGGKYAYMFNLQAEKYRKQE